MKNYTKPFTFFPALILFFLMTASSYSQMVVSKGWQNIDSIRFEVNDDNGAAAPAGETDTRTKTLMDSLGVTVISSYGPIGGSTKPYGTKRKGYDCYPQDGTANRMNFIGAGEYIRQRIYYPSPERIGFWDDGGYRWRYIDTLHYSWHDNTLDSNDISPYAEFDKDTNLVPQTYLSQMYHSTPDTLQVGTDGRIILGYNDQRNGTQMLVSHLSIPFEGGKLPKAFSARLEFNLDTSKADIDTLYTSNSSENVPLLRVQILYKKGQNASNPSDSGWRVLPFVPFKTDTNGTQSGWYKIADDTITLAQWHTLKESWRERDTLQNGIISHDWNFKQLNIMLKNLPSYMPVTTATDYYDGMPEYGSGSSNSRFKNIIANPDSLVAFNSSDVRYEQGSLSDQNTPIFEIRILSTYRTKVRIRSLVWQDTAMDKFLYRAKFGDSTHSLTPFGNYGGWDDSMSDYLEYFADSVAISGCAVRELRLNDINPYLPSTAMSDVGYLEYLSSKVGLHVLMRPQEGGEKTLQMRRERLGYDGQPPSISENQASNTFSARGGGWRQYGGINHVFPGDYIPNSSLASGSPWLDASAHLDTMQGLIIGRPGDTSDFFKAYRTYVESEEIQGVISALRGTAYAALHHRVGKKSAWQSSPPLFGGIDAGAIKDSDFHFRFPLDTLKDQYGGIIHTYTFAQSAYTSFRPPTPEETYAYFYISLANGASSFNLGQCFDNEGTPPGGDGTLFGICLRHHDSDPALLDYSYNFGHRRINWGDSFKWWADSTDNIADAILPPYYLGYANLFRATYRTMSRINNIYDTVGGNKYPFKRFTWLDAFSAYRALQTSTNTVQAGGYVIDTSNAATFRAAFLKCDSTTQVKLWAKGTHGEYLDSTVSGHLVRDSARRTYVEVGLFRDSSSTINAYAALLVNTRLYPDHKTGDDSTYYCQGLDSLNRPHSLFGDIAVRKVWLHIDTTKFDPSFRTQYYVVRDLWHPDSVYLVKQDSNFAVYIKPGDAKFLYIQKGISIQVAKTATLSASGDLLFNNGRRVAERMNRTRTVEAYTRNSKLYVSNGSSGQTVPGYHERSLGDNIATGNEVLLDSVGNIARPSICVGRNDTSVAIAYWKAPDQLWVAFQPHPDSTWRFRKNIQYSCMDLSTDSSGVTPVLAPINDTDWIVAAGFRANNPSDVLHPNSGIIGARFQFDKHGDRQISFYNDGFQYLYEDFYPADTALINQSYFPTIASRPLADSLWPIRLAWQKGGFDHSGNAHNSIILGRRLTWNTTAPSGPILDGVDNISKGLPSYCYNIHPNIAMCNIKDDWLGAIAPLTLDDYVTWEAIIIDTVKSQVIDPNLWYFPVLRQYTQVLNQRNGNWKRVFQIFQPDLTAGSGYRYPVVSSVNYTQTPYFNPNPKKGYTGYHDLLRLIWGNHNENMQTAHWVNGWIQGSFESQETGLYPSMGQTTDDTTNWSNSAVVPMSTVWAGDQTYLGNKEIRITNGWSPIVDYSPAKQADRVWLIFKPGSDTCNVPYAAKGVIDPHLTVVRASGGAQQYVQWSQSDPTDGSTALSQVWPVTPPNPVEIHSDSITLQPGDSIYVSRSFILNDSAGIVTGLAGTGDTLIMDFVLRKSSDSSVISTIEHSYINTNGMLIPGRGLDASNAKFKYPSGSSSVTAFITAEIKRKQLNSLVNVILEYEANDTLLSSEAFKRTAKPQSQPRISTLNVAVVPNPFNQSTMVKISSAEGLPTHVEVFDLVGRKISDLYNDNFPGSPIEIRFEAAMLSAGSYYVRIQSGSEVVTRKIQLMK